MDKFASFQTGSRASIPFYFCTYFDRNYLTRGLALYESLARHCQRPFILWILCFDVETYATLAELNLPEVRLISQLEFESGDEELLSTKHGRSRVEYYWTCSPSLPLYVLKHNPDIDVITYLDADLYFFSDLQPIYDEFGGASILLIEHRYTPELAHLTATSGTFNVGLLSFRHDANGLACLRWWRERCLEWCYNRYEDGKYGDQLYLDDWPSRFDGVAILQNKGAGLAPWNFSLYCLKSQDLKVTVDGQPLIFFHYQGFHCVHKNVVAPMGGAYIPTVFTIKNIFYPYARTLAKLAWQLEYPFVDEGRRMSVYRILSGLFERGLMLTSSESHALLAWSLAFWSGDNPSRVARGFVAYQQGDLRLMRRSFFQAIFFNPLQLTNWDMLSLLVKSFIGEKMTTRLRAWKN